MNTFNIEKAPRFQVEAEVNTAALKGLIQMTFIAMPISETRRIEAETLENDSGVAGFLKAVTASVDQVELGDLPLPALPALPASTKESVGQAIDALADWPALGLCMQRAYHRGMWEEQVKN